MLSWIPSTNAMPLVDRHAIYRLCEACVRAEEPLHSWKSGAMEQLLESPSGKDFPGHDELKLWRLEGSQGRGGAHLRTRGEG